MQAESKMQESSDDGINPEYSQEAKEKLMESMREFDARLRLDRDKFEFEKQKHRDDIRVKEKQITARKTTSSQK
jgi:predicted DNA binding CopG/RHH family protein